MVITEEGLTGTFEQKKALVQQFNLLQDLFFAAVMQDKAAAEYVLRMCTGIRDLRIIESDTQKTFRNLYGKSPVLDFFAEDSNHRFFNIEVQSTDNEKYFGPLRARYYQSIIDASLFPKGLTYESLPETYIIFITPFNPLKKYGHHKIAYEKKMTLEDVVWDNRVHEVYLNCEEKDDSELSEMLQYFLSADSHDSRFGALSEAVHKQKDSEEGITNMCKAVEDFVLSKSAALIAESEARGKAEGKIEGEAEGRMMAKTEIVDLLLEQEMTLEDALKFVRLDLEDYLKAKETMM